LQGLLIGLKTVNHILLVLNKTTVPLIDSLRDFENVDVSNLCLSNSSRALKRLLFLTRVPFPVNDNRLSASSQVKSDTTSLVVKQNNVPLLRLIKLTVEVPLNLLTYILRRVSVKADATNALVNKPLLNLSESSLKLTEYCYSLTALDKLLAEVNSLVDLNALSDLFTNVQDNISGSRIDQLNSTGPDVSLSLSSNKSNCSHSRHALTVVENNTRVLTQLLNSTQLKRVRILINIDLMVDRLLLRKNNTRVIHITGEELTRQGLKKPSGSVVLKRPLTVKAHLSVGVEEVPTVREVIRVDQIKQRE